MQEHEMKPSPDYGLDSYKGSGKLKNKVGGAESLPCAFYSSIHL